MASHRCVRPGTPGGSSPWSVSPAPSARRRPAAPGSPGDPGGPLPCTLRAGGEGGPGGGWVEHGCRTDGRMDQWVKGLIDDGSVDGWKGRWMDDGQINKKRKERQRMKSVDGEIDG